MKKSTRYLRGSVLFALVFVFAMGLGTYLSSEALAQVRPAIVRSVDEPARVPYYSELGLTCSFTNVCTATFPAVPSGKRLRLTNISGIILQQSATSAFVALHRGSPLASQNILVAFPVTPFNMAYFGNSLSFSQEVNFYFEAGETPGIELGTGDSFSNATWNRFNVSGYLVDLLP